MELNGKIKKTQALSGQLVKSHGGGGSVREIYWVSGTTTNAEVNAAVAANKLPVYYFDSTNAYGQPTRDLYYMTDHTPTETRFAAVDNINNRIVVKRLYADEWFTQSIRWENKLTWDYTPISGSNNPVTSGGVYNAIQNATVSPERIADAVDDWLDNHPTATGTFTNAAKNALIALLEKVAYIDDNGQNYLDRLSAELFSAVTSISAVFTQGSATIYDTDSLDALKQYLVVTASYADGTSATVSDYTLSGTLTEGTSTITVSYGGKTDTFSVTVTAWDFEWYASSGVLPSGMTNTSVSWAEGNAYADVQSPIYAIGYSDIDAEIECAWITLPDTALVSNTQFNFSASAQNAVKVYCTNDLKVRFYGGVDGALSNLDLDVSRTDFHKYRVILQDGSADLYVDGDYIATRETRTGQYNFEPLIYSADTSNPNCVALKSIKWRKLS